MLVYIYFDCSSGSKQKIHDVGKFFATNAATTKFMLHLTSKATHKKAKLELNNKETIQDETDLEAVHKEC